MRYLLAMALSAVAPSHSSLAGLYAEARQYDKASFRFVAPPEARSVAMRDFSAELFRALAAGAKLETLSPKAAALGFELLPARDSAGEVWVLREAGPRREGGGFYVLRPQGTPLCVQAPHSFFDEGTGAIALELFALLKAGCFFSSTVHRYSPSDGGDKLADVAHADRTLFRAASQGMLRTVHWPIVQIHGFGPREELPAGTWAVVSDGAKSRPAGSPAMRLRDALAKRVGAGKVLLYGEDARILGATTNVEGLDARQAGTPFVHLELSAAARKQLGGKPGGGGAGMLAEALGEAMEPIR